MWEDNNDNTSSEKKNVGNWIVIFAILSFNSDSPWTLWIYLRCQKLHFMLSLVSNWCVCMWGGWLGVVFGFPSSQFLIIPIFFRTAFCKFMEFFYSFFFFFFFFFFFLVVKKQESTLSIPNYINLHFSLLPFVNRLLELPCSSCSLYIQLALLSGWAQLSICDEYDFQNM